MELNRNQYFFAGILLVLVGLQLKSVSSFELTPETQRLLAKPAAVAQNDSPPTLAMTQNTAMVNGPKIIKPPEWLGWCLISVGSVLILHSLAMKKPD